MTTKAISYGALNDLSYDVGYKAGQKMVYRATEKPLYEISHQQKKPKEDPHEEM